MGLVENDRETPDKVVNDFITSITTEPLLIDHCHRLGESLATKHMLV